MEKQHRNNPDTLVNPKPQNNANPTTKTQEIIDKHKNILYTLLLGMAIGSTSITAIDAFKQQGKNENITAESIENSKNSTYTQRHISVWKKVFNDMTIGEYIFYSRSGKKLEQGKFPKNWDNMTNDEKQQFRDERRKHLSTHIKNLPNNELFIRIASPHANIINEVQKNPDSTTAGKNIKITDIVLSHMLNTVQGDPKNRNRKEYLQDEFARLTGDNIIDNYLKQYIIGKIGVESQFDNGANRKEHLKAIEKNQIAYDKAMGIMQIMPRNLEVPNFNPNKYTYAEVLDSYKKQIEIAKNIARENYEIINKNYTKRVAKMYFDGDERRAKQFFIAPLILNSYNAGSGNIKIVMENFLTLYPDKASIQKVLNNTDPIEYDLFWMMTEVGLEHKLSWKIQGTEKTENYGQDASKYVFKAMAMTEAIQSAEAKYTKNNSKENKKPKENSQTTELKHSEEKGFFGRFWEKTKNFFSWNQHNEIDFPDTLPQNITLPQKNKSTLIDPWMQKYADSFGLKKAKNKSEIMYKPIPKVAPNHEYILSRVGEMDDGPKFGDNNDEDYIKLHPKAQENIFAIHYNFEKTLQKYYNMNDTYTGTFVINSIARDEEYNKNLKNASADSAHSYGIAFDIASNRGYLTNKKTGEQKLLTKENNPEEFEYFMNALRYTLQEMHNKKEVFVIEEFHPPHFHIQSRLGEKEY